MSTTTLTVRGHKLRTGTRRRYIVAIVHTSYESTKLDWVDGEMVRVPITVPAGARVHKRSDSIETARREKHRVLYPNPNRYAVIMDTVTGEEVL